VPGLEQAQFIRFGQMHRNTYLRAPALLNESLNLRRFQDIFVAGQLAGVEGYVEAMATGLIAGMNAWRRAGGQTPLELPRTSALSSMCHYLVHADDQEFAPVRFTFDLLPALEQRLSRQQRRETQCRRALDSLQVTIADLERALCR
jgi:methylenetetrahydrofolate--tRNA-(uracil-5-)-methyltransferase